MRRRIVQYQHRRLIYVPAEVVYRVNQKSAVDVPLAFICDAEVVRAKQAEQVHLLISLRKYLHPLPFGRPTVWQTRRHRERALITKI